MAALHRAASRRAATLHEPGASRPMRAAGPGAPHAPATSLHARVRRRSGPASASCARPRRWSRRRARWVRSAWRRRSATRPPRRRGGYRIAHEWRYAIAANASPSVVVTDNTALIVVDVQRGFADPVYWGERNNPACEEERRPLYRGLPPPPAGRRCSRDMTQHEPGSPLALRARPATRSRTFVTGEPDLLVTKHVNSSFLGDPVLLDPWLQRARLSTAPRDLRHPDEHVLRDDRAHGRQPRLRRAVRPWTPRTRSTSPRRTARS